MKIKTVSTARFVLFLVGCALVCILVWALMPDTFAYSVTSYVMVVGLLAYIALSLPIVFSFEYNDGTLVSGIVYYRGAALFGCASIALAIYAISAAKTSKLLIALEAAAVFGFAVYVLLSLMAGSHVENVHKEEYKKTAMLSVLKSTAVRLQVMADTLDESNYETKRMIQAITDDIRFLSPAKDSEATALERRIIDTICTLDLPNVTPEQLNELQLAVRKRQSLY